MINCKDSVSQSENGIGDDGIFELSLLNLITCKSPWNRFVVEVEDILDSKNFVEQLSYARNSRQIDEQ